MYCRYTSIWDSEQCPLNGGEFLYKECPLSEVPPYMYIYTLGMYNVTLPDPGWHLTPTDC